MLSPRYYKAHLEKVSRSFAFCIDELRDSLQAEVALAYLLFRVLDTVEDSTWSQANSQKQGFLLFEKLVSGDLSVFDEFVDLILLSNAKKEEKELVAESLPLFENLLGLEESRKTPLLASIQIMSEGMQHFALEKKHKIETLQDLDRYCYIVAGCIGELLTDWTFVGAPEVLRNKSRNFGLFLQKINILKDFIDDSSAGRSFLWSWQEVASTLENHAREAFDYLQQIPEERDDYKIFCAWSLFLGLLSYPTIEKSLKSGKREKISRLETWQLLNHVKKIIFKEKEMNTLFDKFISHLPQKAEAPLSL